MYSLYNYDPIALYKGLVKLILKPVHLYINYDFSECKWASSFRLFLCSFIFIFISNDETCQTNKTFRSHNSYR